MTPFKIDKQPPRRVLARIGQTLTSHGPPTPEGVLLGSGKLATELDRLDLIDEYKLLGWAGMSCQCQPVSFSKGTIARMCLAVMRPSDASAMPNSPYSSKARGPSR